MRVLVSTTSGLGHVQPVLPLARALQQAGHEVMWVTAADAVPWLEAAGVSTAAAGLSAGERMARFLARHPEWNDLQGEERANAMFPRMFGAIGASAAVDGVLAAAEAFGPDLVVHEQAELAAPAVAARLGVPNVCHGFGLVVPAERVALAAELGAGVWAGLGLEVRPYAGCYDHLYVDVYPPSLQPEPLPHLGRRVHRRPESGDAAPGEALAPEVAARVGSGRPLAYLTFGTVFNVNPVFAESLRGLAGLDAEVVVTVGPGGDPASLGPQPDHVLVTEYVPQSLLLPSVDVVVSHAGSGTLLTALSLGLPQLCLPQAADQFRNAQRCTAAGAGLSLAGPEVTADAVAAGVRQLLEEDRFRRSAATIAAEIAAMPSPADLVPVLEELAGA